MLNLNPLQGTSLLFLCCLPGGSNPINCAADAAFLSSLGDRGISPSEGGTENQVLHAEQNLDQHRVALVDAYPIPNGKVRIHLTLSNGWQVMAGG
jgi:hypothetical protein